jgi:hypothetical protein
MWRPVLRGCQDGIVIMGKKRAEVRQLSQIKDKIWPFVFSATILSFYFVYLLLRIETKLIYQYQEPVFFFDRYFINDFFSYPGGVNELTSRFLSQFFYYSWTGALLLVLIFWLITWNTKLLIRSISKNKHILYLHWIPSVVLLALHSNYRYPLVLTVGLLWILLGVNIYLRLVYSSRILRFMLYIILQAMLYYVAAGQVFVFSITVILYEVLICRRIVLPLLYIIYAGLLPYIGASYLFIIYTKDAYAMQLTSYTNYKVTWLSWALYIFFPFVLLLLTLERKYGKVGKKGARNLWERFLYHRSISIRIIQGVIFLFLVVVAALYSYDRDGKDFLLINNYAQFRKWDKILDMARQGVANSNIVQCQINRALYHSGRLCDELFSLPQHFGVNGLFMHQSMRHLFPLQHSDVFFDLGLINESEHWAHEAVAVRGDTSWNLQRLALVNLSEENKDVAARYLDILQKSLWHKSWATKYQKCLSNDNDLCASTQFQYLKSAMPESDFLVSPIEPERCLEELLKNSEKNKMAFEYFMAYCLLEGEIGRFMKHLHLLNDFDYPKIPRHFEEAMLIYMQLTDRKIALPGREISKETVRRFIEFNQVMTKYNKNKDAAYKDLLKYRDTYWFYGLYYYQSKQ